MDFQLRMCIVAAVSVCLWQMQDAAMFSKTRPLAQDTNTWFSVAESKHQFYITNETYSPFLCKITCMAMRGNGIASIGPRFDPSTFLDLYWPESTPAIPEVWILLTNVSNPNSCFTLSHQMKVARTDCNHNASCLCVKDPPPKPTFLKIDSMDAWHRLPSQNIEAYVSSDNKSLPECQAECYRLKAPNSGLANVSLASQILAPAFSGLEYFWMQQPWKPNGASDCTLTKLAAGILPEGHEDCTTLGHCICQTLEQQTTNAITMVTKPAAQSVTAMPPKSHGMSQVIRFGTGNPSLAKPPTNRLPVQPHKSGVEFQCPEEPKSVFGHIKRCFKMNLIN